VVDDNNDALESLGMLVRLLGHEVAMGRDGLEAVEAVKRFRPEVVLMDLGMPNLNGYDAAKQIRELPNGGPLLLVATTGWGHAEDRERTRAAGFDHHLVKPIDPEAIRQLLDGLPPQDGEAEPRESVAG
jgi:CheY-like chemotaxis protein